MGQFGAHFSQEYWRNLKIAPDDIQNLSNILFEQEEPLPIEKLTSHLIQDRIAKLERQSATEQSQRGEIYYPRGNYAVGDKLQFGQFDWMSGTVTGKRAGNNPVLGEFEVITVEFEDGTYKNFAAGLLNHPLNEADYQADHNEQTNLEQVQENYGSEIRS